MNQLRLRRWSAEGTELKNEGKDQSLLCDHLFYRRFFEGDSSN